MNKLLKYSVLINSFIWFAFGLAIFTGLHRGIPEDLSSRMMMGIMAWLAGGGLYLFYSLAQKYSVRWYYVLFMELLFILFLTVADEFGWADVVVLITHMVSLVSLPPKLKK